MRVPPLPYGRSSVSRGLFSLPPSLLTGSSSGRRFAPIRCAPHCQFVDPECLVVRHTVMEVGQHHELVVGSML